MFFEVRCPGCERRGWCPCPDCVASLPAPASGPIGGLAATVSLFDHDELGARFVHALKLHNDRAILRWLAHSLVATVAARGIEAELITWAPTTAAARRERGFDQAELLARAIARASGVRVRSLLRRIDGPTQHGRTRAQRLSGPRFELRRPAAARSVLVVDDVLTTGATLVSAAATLRRSGVAVVYGATCSRVGGRSEAVVVAGSSGS